MLFEEVSLPLRQKKKSNKSLTEYVQRFLELLFIYLFFLYGERGLNHAQRWGPTKHLWNEVLCQFIALVLLLTARDAEMGVSTRIIKVEVSLTDKYRQNYAFKEIVSGVGVRVNYVFCLMLRMHVYKGNKGGDIKREAHIRSQIYL